MVPRLPLLLPLLLAVLAGAPARATSVRSLGIRELAARAGLVFEGRALAREVRAEGPAIRTCVQFEVLELLKGPAVASPLELCFAGGTLGARTRQVHGMHAPEPGERGIYFVDRLGAPRVHPLLGWDQGRFLVREGAAPEVTTAAGAPVAALEPAEEGRALGPSRGVARGARLARPGGRGLAPDAFKARLREILAEPAP
jgi:hypothetical protein